MGLNENERNKYKEILYSLNKKIDNLLQISRENVGLIDNEKIKALQNYEKECKRLYQKLDKNEFEIAIVGLEKAGKSTFANALMENKILPDADERCTYTSTCICYGEEDRAHVKFFTLDEFNSKLRQTLDDIGIENSNSYSIESLSLSEYKQLFDKLDKDKKDRFENNANKDIINILENKNDLINLYLGKEDKFFKQKELESDDLKDYIVNPKIAITVKEVVIQSSKLEKMKNAIIYDVPGFDSPTKMHAEQTEDRMKKADAIILIASAEKPSITGPSLDMFNKVADEDNIRLRDKLFIFGNRADAANTLEKNINTLKEEAIKYNLLAIENLNTRLLVGSAKAYLQKIGKEKGDNCVKKLEEDEYKSILIDGDGIDKIYERLIEYNNTYRFEILKIKITKSAKEIIEIFEQLKEKYSENSSSFSYLNPLFKEKDKLYAEASKKLVKGLEELRENIRNKYNQDASLSKDMQNKIEELFQNNEHLISDDDINNAKRKIEGIVSSVNVEKVERIIREEKFKNIYSQFFDIVLKVTTDDYKEYYNDIINLFKNALQIDENSTCYKEIENNINNYIQKYKKIEEDEGNYQSLIERFARDLIEILILQPYGTEARLNRFLDDSRVFAGLIMFYDIGDNTANYKKTFMSIAPKDHPLLYTLLFHEYKGSMTLIKEMFNSIKNTLGYEEIIKYIFGVICKNPGIIINNLTDILVKQKGIFDKFKNQKECIDKINSELKLILEKSNKNTPTQKNDEIAKYDFTDTENFIKQYKKHFGNMKKREYEDIEKDYLTDLEILKNFLISASIPAISIEKPFIAKEVKSIEELIESVNSEIFSNFISDNLNLLNKSLIDEFENKQKKLTLYRSIVKEIEIEDIKNMLK